MTSDDGALIADLEEERLLAQIKGAYLEGTGRGKLSLTSRRIEFEHRKGLLSSPQVAFSVDLSRVFSAKAKHASNTLTLEWVDEAGASVTGELSLPEDAAAARLVRILNSRLRSLKEEADQREQWALYQSFLWETAYHAWLSARQMGRIVQGLLGQDWDAVEAASVDAAASAVNLPDVDTSAIEQALHALAQTVSSRDASLVLKEVMAAYSAMAKSLNSQTPPGDRWGEIPSPPSGGLSWQHIRYIFLFSAWYALISVWRQSGKTDKVDRFAPRMTPLLTIVADGISPELQPVARAGGATSDLSFLDSAARNLQALLEINAGIV
jgi:hypothetical protein